MLLSALLTLFLAVPSSPVPLASYQGASAPDPEATRQALEWFRSDDVRKRCEGLEVLASNGGYQAVKVLLEALGDEDPLVADTAQMVFPLIEGWGAVETLQGREGILSRNRNRQLRCAEIIGRMEGEVDAQALLKALKRRDIERSRYILWSIERLAAKGTLKGKKERTIKAVRHLTGRGDNDRVRAAAMQALSILDPWDGAISMDNLRQGTGVETASAIMDTLVKLKPSGFVGALGRGLSHETPGVRMRAIDMLMKGGIKRPSLDALIDRLGEEPRAAIRSRVLQSLHYFTGHLEDENPDAWRDFARELPVEWTSQRTLNSFRERPNVTGKLDRLEDLNPRSDRVAVLLDVSASYWEPTPSGKSLAEVIAPEVEALLRRLDQSGSFFFVPFSGAPLSFSEGPIPSSQENLELARTFLFETLPATADRNAPSNISAAIDHALDCEEIDRIIVFSGASEYVGRNVDVELMARLYRERTRFRPAIFDFILLNVSAAGPPRWFRLANPRGGRIFRLAAR